MFVTRLRSSIRTLTGSALLVFAAWLLIAAWLAPGRGTVQAHTQARESSAGTSPKRIAEATSCVRCHAGIVASYERTAMARASGFAMDGLVTGGFEHADSGVQYKVFARDGDAWLSYEGTHGGGRDAELAGERRLLYYIGSNKRGRTYLYAQPLDAESLDAKPLTRSDSRGGVAALSARAAESKQAASGGTKLWFEAPINWYSKRAVWDMAPAYEHAHTAPLALPVDNNCLHCHASAVQAPLATARNAYAGEPFAQPGIGCAACHGDASAHVASGGKVAALNPDKLTPVRRDSVCLQCHLEGDAVVYKPGRVMANFVAGDDLGDFAAYFVNTGNERSTRRAASQYEALLRSACRRAAGDKLTCTTCHNPHSDPAPAERVAFYRAGCLQCHNSPMIATRHHPEQPDCASCHMPTRVTSDISHEQTTDHDIEARPRKDMTDEPARASLAGEANLLTPIAKSQVNLVPVGTWTVTDRERGLAYAQWAARGDRSAAEQALRLLTRAASVNGAGLVGGASVDHDVALHEQRGFLEQLNRDLPAAEREYRAALAAEPENATAATNLAVLEAGLGHVAEARTLLGRVARNDPAQTAALLDLAAIDCAGGAADEARALVRRALRFNPDDPAAQKFLATGTYAGLRCRWNEAASRPAPLGSGAAPLGKP